MPTLSVEQRAAIAIGVPVVALLLYLWYRRRQNSQFREEDKDYVHVEESDVVASANQRTLEVKIPRAVVGVIIGKSGANIKKIQKDTEVRMNLIDEDEEGQSSERTLLIQGEREKVKRAEIVIKKVIAEQPVIRTEDVFVPQRACGRIIGKGGQTIRHMSAVSGAKIRIDPTSDDISNPLRKCTITGTSDQIASAKGLLNEKMAEDNEIRACRRDAEVPRNRHAPRKLESAVASPTTGVVQFPAKNDFFEVFVSAVENPGHFWVQLLTKDSPDLDQLTKNLTLLYSSSESQAILNSFKVGEICCAPFEYDSSWYRARITEIGEEGLVDLYYVDYGDSGKISIDKLRELKPEHKQLPFQAIECFLAGVTPKDGEWSQESTDDFDHLSHCAQWVSLMARVVKYSGDIPCLELIDTAGPTDVNINEEMIKKQFAVHEVDVSSAADEHETGSPSDEKTGKSELQETAEEIAPAAHNGVLGGAPQGVMQSNTKRKESVPPAETNGDINEEALQDLTETIPLHSSTGLQSKPSGSDLRDGPYPADVTDSGVEMHGPVTAERDSPVKAAVVKTISQDYIPPPANSVPGMPNERQAALGVVQDQDIRAVLTDGVQSQPEVSETTGHIESVTSPEKAGGYRSSLNITPSSRRTLAATFSGSRHVSEKTETSVKTVTSTVHRQIMSSKQSYVSTVTLPERDTDDVIVSVTPSVTQLQSQSPSADWESRVFKASNESTAVTRHVVASEVHRTVTQSNGRESATEVSASRLEQKSTAHSSSSQAKPKVTYEINFESFKGVPGNKQYSIKKSFSSAENEPREAIGDMSPSGSLMEISKNSVIDEEDEFGEKADQDGSPEPDSDTESFVSAREEITSDTDTAAYMTAAPGGSSTSLDTDSVLVDSAADETITPVNSDTEVEEEGSGGRGLATPEPVTYTGEHQGRSNTLKGLKEQMADLGSGVTSEAELGYRGDTEEGVESAED